MGESQFARGTNIVVPAHHPAGRIGLNQTVNLVGDALFRRCPIVGIDIGPQIPDVLVVATTVGLLLQIGDYQVRIAARVGRRRLQLRHAARHCEGVAGAVV